MGLLTTRRGPEHALPLTYKDSRLRGSQGSQRALPKGTHRARGTAVRGNRCALKPQQTFFCNPWPPLSHSLNSHLFNTKCLLFRGLGYRSFNLSKKGIYWEYIR